MTEQTVAIIGFGTAGVNAAIALRSEGFDGRIVAITQGPAVPYSPILTSYYAGGQKSFEECFPWTAAELACLSVEVIERCAVEEIDVQARTLRTVQGSISYDKCVIATGSDPVTRGFPQVEGFEPLTLRSMEDAARLREVAENAACRRVLVSGASMVALKTLEACVLRGLDVTLVGMMPHVLDMNALPVAAERFERGLERMGVTLKLGTTISAVEVVSDAEGFEGRRLKVTFANGDVEQFDHISVAHGMRSNLGFIPAGALVIDRALVVDDFMRTSDPDVYAAGDVAQALELISGEKRIVGIWKNAAVQGACAGRAIACELSGREVPASYAYAGSISTNTIVVGDLLFISAGTIEITDVRRVEVRERDDMLVVYIYEGERLVGFNLVCDNSEARSVAYDTGGMLTIRIERALR